MSQLAGGMMFTGLIESLGEVISNDVSRLVIKVVDSSIKVGESLAINGVCLTVTAYENQQIIFDLSPETLALTTLGSLKKGDKVNIEQAMLATARFDGHYVSGHVDTTACLKAKNIAGEFVEIIVSDFATYATMSLLPKGSIALDGVSLTINEAKNDEIKLMLIPHTLAKTTFGQLQIGQRMNVEFDYLTRIVQHQLNITGQLKNEVF